MNNMAEKLLWLEALEAAGVENWEGYAVAISIYDKWQDEIQADMERRVIDES